MKFAHLRITQTRIWLPLVVFISLSQTALRAETPVDQRLPFAPARLPAPTPQGDRSRMSGPALTNPAHVTGREDRKPSTATSLIGRLEEMERIQQRRLRGIQEKLDRLKQIVMTCQPYQRETAPSAAAASPATPQSSATSQAAQAEAVMPVPVESERETHKETSGETGGPNLAEPPSPTPRPIHKTPTVDNLALANNLFAQGKLDLARPLYEKLIHLPQEPTDFIWIQYQLASCYRMEGRIKEATKLYRMVASTKGNEYWKTKALWWLDYLSRSQTLFQRQQGLHAKLETLKKAADELRAE